MFKSKKGVSEVITTVLMIVLVVAAIGILAVVVINLVRQNVGGLESDASCLTNSFTVNIESACINQSNSVVNVRVKRNSGDDNFTSLAFFVDGQRTTFSPSSIPSVGETRLYSATASTAQLIGKNLELAIVSGSKTCPIADSKTINNGTSVLAC